MESKLGPLQAVIDQEGARAAKGEAMKEKDVGLTASLKARLQRLCREACVLSLYLFSSLLCKIFESRLGTT